MLGGVCGGLGEFFGIDPTLVRLFFVLLALLGGHGVLIYLILWLIVPVRPAT
jgi:phage shock protein C